MFKVKIIATGAVVSESEFFNMHPTIGFPQPLTDFAIFPYGAQLVDVEPTQDFRITKLAFRNRFTQLEKAMIELAATDDPSSDMQIRMQSASLRAYLKDLDAATYINLTDQSLHNALVSIEAMELIALERSTEILSTEIAASERYIA